MQILVTLLNSPNKMHILSGGSNATLILINLSYDIIRKLHKNEIKPTFDQLIQFEQLIFPFPIDTVETIASNYHWVHHQINRTSQKLLIVVSGNRNMT